LGYQLNEKPALLAFFGLSPRPLREVENGRKLKRLTLGILLMNRCMKPGFAGKRLPNREECEIQSINSIFISRALLAYCTSGHLSM
jgi:hypothetical protein